MQPVYYSYIQPDCTRELKNKVELVEMHTFMIVKKNIYSESEKVTVHGEI